MTSSSSSEDGSRPPRPQPRPPERTGRRAVPGGEELTLRQHDRELVRVRIARSGEPVRVFVPTAVSSTAPLALSVVRTAAVALRGEIRIGDELHLVVKPGQVSASTTIPPLREDFGEVVLQYRELDPEDLDAVAVLCEVCFEVDAPKAIQTLYERLVADLERVHLGLAREVMGRTRHAAGFGRNDPQLARPEEHCQALETVLDRLDPALARIQRQPVHAITRDVVRDRWRPGDRLAADATRTLLQEPDTVVIDGRLRQVGRIRVRRSRPSLDVPEHRILRHELEDLGRRALRIVRHCTRCIEQLGEEQRRWGGARADGSSVFQVEHLPRVRRYERLAGQASALADRFARLRFRSDFLDGAGPARTPLRPTPLFLNGPGYREAYRALRDGRRSAAPLVSGDEFRIHFRSLSRLFEYWCFIEVVERLRTWLGKSAPGDEYEVIDDTYRPDLRPGQSFRFDLADGGRVIVHYEPDIVPVDWAGSGHHRFRATLSTAPLRPDVLVEVERPDEPPIALVLDAKSTSRFENEALWRPTDYRARIFDPQTGTLPVRQVFFVHRDQAAPDLENLPGYLAGTRSGRDASIIGAVACLPWSRNRLAQVLRRFLLTHAGPLGDLEEPVDE